MNLKTCPFCGCAAHIVSVDVKGFTGSQVYCSGCMLRLPQHFKDEVFTSEAEAMKAWNRRDGTEAIRDETRKECAIVYANKAAEQDPDAYIAGIYNDILNAGKKWKEKPKKQGRRHAGYMPTGGSGEEE